MMDLLEVSRAEGQKLQRIATEIRDLSFAFSKTGNEMVANQLLNMSLNIRDSEERYSKAVAANLDREYRQSVQSSVNVLNSALAGVQLARKTPG